MNTVIPLNARINTKDEYIITPLDTEDKDVLNKKNTLQFQSTLSPFWKKEENKIYTTSGHRLELSNNRLIDENGKTYDLDNSWVLEYSADITSLWSGELTSAVIYNNKIYALYKTENTYWSVVKDLDTEVVQTYSLSVDTSCITNDVKLFQSKTNIEPKIVRAEVFTSSTKISVYNWDFTNAHNTTFNSPMGKDLYAVYLNNTYYIGFDDTDVRKRGYFTFNGSTFTFVTYGWGCIGLNGLVTGEPIPYSDNTKTSGEWSITSFSRPIISNWSNYTFLDNGIGSIKNRPNITNTLPANVKRIVQTGNFDRFGAMDFTCYIFMCAGFDLVNNVPLILTPSLTGNSSNSANNTFRATNNYLVIKSNTTDTPQVDFTDQLGTIPENWDGTISSGNPFPLVFSIFNRAESRGVYWDYGAGWVKCYYRQFGLSTGREDQSYEYLYQFYRTAIISFGLDSNLSTNAIRLEWLSPATVNSSVYYESKDDDPAKYSRDYRWHSFNNNNKTEEDLFLAQFTWVDMIGADNMPNHSVLSALPFNVSIIPEVRLYEQFYQLNYVSTSMQGTLLSSGSADKNEQSQIYFDGTNYSIYTNGLICLVKPSGNIKISKLADYIYKTNTLVGNNIILDSKESITAMRGFIPYNGEEIITWDSWNDFADILLPIDNTNADGNSTYYTASGYNIDMNDLSKRATSYILPAATMPLAINSEVVQNYNFQFIDNKREISKPFVYGQFTYKDDAVDHYYNHSLNSTSIEYQLGKKVLSSPNGNSQIYFGGRIYDANKDGTVWWTTSTIYIFPLGISSKISGINYLTSSVELTDDYTVRLYRRFNATFPSYNPTTEVYKGQTIFTIYGYNYSFDGQSIYYLGSGEDTTQNNFACYALGMKFLANSGTEAYFYSSFEKRLYLFTGSVTLQAADSLAREGLIIDSLYSSNEQTLYLLTDTGNVLAKTQNDMCLITNIDSDKYHFEGTETGMILVSDNGYKKFRLWQTDETEWLPLEYETEFLGKNDSLYKVNGVEITFFAGDGRSIKGNVYFECLYDKMPEKSKRPFEIESVYWKKSKLQKLTFRPDNNVVKAFRFGLDSPDYLHIAGININVDEVSQNTNSIKHI